MLTTKTSNLDTVRFTVEEKIPIVIAPQCKLVVKESYQVECNYLSFQKKKDIEVSSAII